MTGVHLKSRKGLSGAGTTIACTFLRGLQRAFQLAAHGLGRMTYLPNGLAKALLGDAKLVGPILNLVRLLEVDARPICTGSR